MKKINLEISKTLSLYMKGVAIIIISLHNIIHKLPNVPLENEFLFSQNGFNLFFSNSFFKHPFYYIFSFLGHYGVQVFIFLSAYTFYIKKESIINFSNKEFYKKRFYRIFAPVIIAIIIVSILNVVLRLYIQDSVSTKTIINSFLGTYIGGALHLLTVHPFLPKNTPGGIGPWWFISFILQFYLLLPFLLKIKYTQAKCLILIITGIVFNFIFTTYKPFNINVFYTVFGHFPEIIFAFYYAQNLRHKNIRPIILFTICLISAILTLYCNSNAYSWYLATLPATICFLSLLLLFKRISGKKTADIFIFIGKISIYIFLLNGMTRLFFIPAINKASEFTSAVLILIYLISTILISYVLYTLESFISTKTNLKKLFF